MSGKDGLRTAKATVENIVTQLTLEGKPGQLQTFLQWFSETFPAAPKQESKGSKKQRSGDHDAHDAHGFAAAAAVAAPASAGQHGHSHGGKPCHGHGEPAAPPPQQQQQQHGHSHGGKPCHGHGEPAAPPPQQQQHGHSHGGKPCHGHGEAAAPQPVVEQHGHSHGGKPCHGHGESQEQHGHSHGHGHGGDEEMSPEELAMHKLFEMKNVLKDMVPVSALGPGEEQLKPVVGPNKDMDASITVHVDSFLYNEHEIEDLVESGDLHRSYCLDCGSRNIKPLNFISHSASMNQIYFMFHSLPNLKGKTVVDVGSRLGNILYAGCLLTKAKRLIGIEKSEYFCNIQRQMVQKFHMGDRIEIIESDVLNQTEILKTADVVILNGVVEFFASQAEQAAFWEFMAKTLKQNCVIIASPSLEEAVEMAQAKVDVSAWVIEKQLEYPADDDEEDEFSAIHMYLVRKPYVAA